MSTPVKHATSIEDAGVTITDPYEDTRHGRPWAIIATRGPVVDVLRYRTEDEALFGHGLLILAAREGRVELARAIRDERIGGYAR